MSSCSRHDLLWTSCATMVVKCQVLLLIVSIVLQSTWYHLSGLIDLLTVSSSGPWLIDQLTKWVTVWPISWLTNWFIDCSDCLTVWLMDCLIILLTDWLPSGLKDCLTLPDDWLTLWLTKWLTNWLISWLFDWVADYLTAWMNDLLTDLPILLTDWLAD